MVFDPINKILGKGLKTDKFSLSNEEKIKCSFCDGYLGATEYQKHSNPDYAEYKTCNKCGYQWAKKHWKSLREDSTSKNAQDKYYNPQTGKWEKIKYTRSK